MLVFQQPLLLRKKNNYFFDEPPTSILGLESPILYLFEDSALLLFIAFPAVLIIKKVHWKHPVHIYLLGALSIVFFMILGHSLKDYLIYNLGSACCAFLWSYAMFRDIHQLLNKYQQNQSYEKDLAAAQFAQDTDNPLNLEALSFNQLDETYPFKEREDLIEALKTSQFDQLEPKAQTLTKALKDFVAEDLTHYKTRIKEVLFILSDQAIFNGGDPKTHLQNLENQGQAIQRAADLLEIETIFCKEFQAIANSSPKPIQRENDILAEKCKTYILKNYHRDISLNDIADANFISKSHMVKIFKQNTGQTVNQYLNELRINKSKLILAYKSITETALEVGFNNSGYFATVFKKHTGLTPKQFQQSLNKELTNTPDGSGEQN